MMLPGLPRPPARGSAALAPGTYDGVVVVVTGGGTGLGKAIAVEFARLGAAVAVLSRDEDHRAAGVAAVEEAAANATRAPEGSTKTGPGAAGRQLSRQQGGRQAVRRRGSHAGGRSGRRAFGAPCDIRDPDAVAAAFDGVTAALGPIDVLVNNAAGNFPVPAEDMSPNAWRTVVDIVLNGTFICSRELARRLIGEGRDGAIVNVGASYAWTGGPGFAHSAAAKAGVKNMTETLAVEWAPYGIRVNGLVPGLFPHEDEVAAITAVPGRSGDVEVRVPALRVGAPRELGWAATFLCSPYASYITGHTLVVDGANWQRRSALQPPFVPIREQLGRPPFGQTEPPGDEGRGASAPATASASSGAQSPTQATGDAGATDAADGAAPTGDGEPTGAAGSTGDEGATGDASGPDSGATTGAGEPARDGAGGGTKKPRPTGRPSPAARQKRGPRR